MLDDSNNRCFWRVFRGMMTHSLSQHTSKLLSDFYLIPFIIFIPHNRLTRWCPISDLLCDNGIKAYIRESGAKKSHFIWSNFRPTMLVCLC